MPLDESLSWEGEIKDIFSANLVRLSTQGAVHLVKHSRGNLQKWFGCGLNLTQI